MLMKEIQFQKGDGILATKLFSPLFLRTIEFRNRIFVSPMCQYSSVDGVPNDWHMVHLGSRAVGGAGLVIAEATAVTPEGRISPGDLGIWNDHQVAAFQKITSIIAAQGSVPGIQLAHAGRKASTAPPWKGGGPVKTSEGGWHPVAPSALPFADGYPSPHELSQSEIAENVSGFAEGALRALEAGFKVVELHMAHGYLMHEFLSPLTNKRSDEYGGDLEGRARFPLHVAKAVRDVWPADLPLFVRISATDWVEGGWDLNQSVTLAKWLRDIGVDLIDCSSGGLVPHAKVPVAPGYQVPFAATIRREVNMPTGAVGLITEARQAEDILQKGEADAVILARAMLRDPYWPMHAAKELSVDFQWPMQYVRAKN
jgi:2,4-dienoyl-CoA reductase-like NADH-dependent reductase (Old Yellow Enzyme family)